MSHTEALGCSIRRLFREFVIAQKARDDAADRDTRLAWTVAALTRTQKMPSLRTLMTRVASRPQTLADHRRALEMLSQQFGIPLRKREQNAG